MTPAQQLQAMIAELAARQALKRSLVRVEQFVAGRRVTVPHVLIAGRLVELTPQQIKDLEEQ